MGLRLLDILHAKKIEGGGIRMGDLAIFWDNIGIVEVEFPCIGCGIREIEEEYRREGIYNCEGDLVDPENPFRHFCAVCLGVKSLSNCKHFKTCRLEEKCPCSNYARRGPPLSQAEIVKAAGLQCFRVTGGEK